MAGHARARSARRLERTAIESRRTRHGRSVVALARGERARGDAQDALGPAAERLAAHGAGRRSLHRSVGRLRYRARRAVRRVGRRVDRRNRAATRVVRAACAIVCSGRYVECRCREAARPACGRRAGCRCGRHRLCRARQRSLQRWRRVADHRQWRSDRGDVDGCA